MNEEGAATARSIDETAIREGPAFPYTCPEKQRVAEDHEQQGVLGPAPSGVNGTAA